MRIPLRSLALALAVVAAPLSAPAEEGTQPAGADKPKQVVIISFDGAHEISQWQRSRALAKATGAHFTYFLSCVFLLSPETKTVYHPPGKSAGRSNIGFSHSRREVEQLVTAVWRAHLEGHDIASHACGHFDGKSWSQADWQQELQAARRIMRDAWSINGIDHEPPSWRRFVEHDVIGLRAPYLSTGGGHALDDALAAEGFRYNASGVSMGPAVPAERNGLLQFALPEIREGPKGRRVIAMDYNLYVRHSGGRETGDADGSFENRAFDAFEAAFREQYEGGRIPLSLGFHFTLMNGGAYWRALERFATDVCTRADVSCISYADYAAAHPPAASASAKSENFGG